MSARTCEDSDLTSRLEWKKRVCWKPLSLYRGKTYHVMLNSHDHQPFTFWSCGECEIKIGFGQFSAQREKVLECCSWR